MTALAFLIGIIVGIGIGMLIWRNNARKFKDIEDTLAKASKTIEGKLSEDKIEDTLAKASKTIEGKLDIGEKLNEDNH